ncbi:MAG: DUF1540 domain-containing protein [Lysinibacillus sp.]
MPTVEVNCSVSNCVYHAKDNLCEAEKIEIDMDYLTKNNIKTEFAKDFDIRSMKEEASKSSDTRCKTFVSKEDQRK